MELNLREISYFLKVAELGSLGSAAAALSITQPALSRSLKRLEDRLGAELFVRHALGMELTAFGQAFIPHARILRADIDRTVEDISLMMGASRGTARIGIIPSIVDHILPGVFRNVLQKSPQVQIQVIEASSDRLVTELECGNIDFAVANAHHAILNENIRFEEFLKEEICVVGRRGHPAISRAPLEVRELLDHSWIVPEKGNAIWIEFRKLFMRAGLDTPPANVSANTAHTLKAAIETSDLLTALPSLSFKHESEAGVLQTIPLRAPATFRHLSILRRVGRPLLPTSNMVLSEIRSIANNDMKPEALLN